MKSFNYLYDYYPESISEVSEEQKRTRQLVQDFMTGVIAPQLFSDLVSRAKDIVASEGVDLVCFAPGSTASKTILRFGELAEALDRELDCDVFLDAVTIKFDADPVTHQRCYQCNKKRVKGKNVLFVGGVFLTGESLKLITELLLIDGAKKVCGLFVAKTTCSNYTLDLF